LGKKYGTLISEKNAIGVEIETPKALRRRDLSRN